MRPLVATDSFQPVGGVERHLTSVLPHLPDYAGTCAERLKIMGPAHLRKCRLRTGQICWIRLPLMLAAPHVLANLPVDDVFIDGVDLAAGSARWSTRISLGRRSLFATASPRRRVMSSKRESSVTRTNELRRTRDFAASQPSMLSPSGPDENDPDRRRAVQPVARES